MILIVPVDLTDASYATTQPTNVLYVPVTTTAELQLIATLIAQITHVSKDHSTAVQVVAISTLPTVPNVIVIPNVPVIHSSPTAIHSLEYAYNA